MKSSFLSLWISTLLLTSVAWGQTKMKTQRPPRPAVSKPTPVAPQKTLVKEDANKTSFDKFYERLKIGYFGILTTPTFENMEKGDWENAAISPEFSGGTNKDSSPTNIWHQVSLNYNFGAKLSFVVVPRFITPLAHPVSMKSPEDRSFINLDDMLVGFAGVIYASDDKKFNLWVRPALRLPTSHASRNSNNGGEGHTTPHPDIAYMPSYTLNKQIEIGFFGIFRMWVIEDNYSCFNRCRMVTAPYFYYSFSDSTKLQIWYEHIIESDRRGKPSGEHEPHYKDVWQNAMVGVSQDVGDRLNVFPFVAAFINDVPFSNDSFWLGAQISYKIK